MKVLLLFAFCLVKTVEFAATEIIDFNDKRVNPSTHASGSYVVEDYVQHLQRSGKPTVNFPMKRTTYMTATIRPDCVLTRVSNMEKILDSPGTAPERNSVRQCDFETKLSDNLKLFLANRHQGDQAGHILGATIGGLCNEINFMPQAREVNVDSGYRNYGSGWSKNEGSIRFFLSSDTNSNRYVNYEVWLEYPTNSGRPSIMKYKTVYYEAGIPICIECNALTNDASNKKENEQPYPKKDHADCDKLMLPGVATNQDSLVYNKKICSRLITDSFADW